MKKKLFLVITFLIVIICSSVINNNIKDKSKIVNYDGNKLFVTIDEVSMNELPSSGNYYLTSYDCNNASTEITWDRTNYKLVVSNKKDGGGVSCNLKFKSRPLLSEMEVGSYVDYVGSGGTVGSTSVACKNNATGSSSSANNSEAPDSCHGQNAREDLDSSNKTYGYCSSEGNKFHVTGWRIAYVKDGHAKLISAGSPECVAVTHSTANDTFIKTANARTLKYCNNSFVEGNCTCTSTTSGQCDSASTDVWNINDADFYYMTRAINNNIGKRLSEGSSLLGDIGGSIGDTLYCDSKYSLKECGYNNDLIDNGGYYWFSTKYNSSEAAGIAWEPNYRVIMADSWSESVGIRPVINMAESVVVTGGSGTKDDPYTIYNEKKLSSAEAGSYVKYIGNNGCTGDSCSGVNANSSSTSNGYCYDSTTEFINSGWRIAYTNSTTAYLVSAGAIDCLCTNSDGTTSNSSCASYISDTELTKHIENLNKKSLNYCNAGFSHQGICDNTTNWNIHKADFDIITSNNLAIDNCYNQSTSNICGYENQILDNGSYYWYATEYSASTYRLFVWDPINRYVDRSRSNLAMGVRPIIKLDSNVRIVDGTGTVSDPYILYNPDSIEDLSGNMNNGALIGGATWNKKDGLLTTDGVDDVVNMGLKSYDFGNTASLVLRVKYNSLPASGAAYETLGNWGGAGMGLLLKNDSTKGLAFDFNPYIKENSAYSDVYYYSSNIFADTWYTLVGTYDGTTAKLYLNGSLVSSVSVSGTIKPLNMKIALGANPDAGESYVDYSDATYDYALVYDRVLTASEIAANFNNTELVDSNLNKNNLLIYYNFGK